MMPKPSQPTDATRLSREIEKLPRDSTNTQHTVCEKLDVYTIILRQLGEEGLDLLRELLSAGGAVVELRYFGNLWCL